MFTTTITHKDLSEAGLLITEGFRGYKASPELIKLSKRAESFARASVTADHDLAGLYDYAYNKWNGEVLTSVIRNLRTELTDEDKALTTKTSRGGNYEITVPNYFINEVKHYGEIRDVNAFIQKMHTKVSQFKTARKKIDPETKLPLSTIYKDITAEDSNSKYEVVDAYLLKLMELISEKNAEKKMKKMMKEFNIVSTVLVDSEKVGADSNGKLYIITSDEIIPA